MAEDGWDTLAQLIAARDPWCRGAVILGLNQPIAVLAESFTRAHNPIVKGFMVGRSLWADPALRWLRQECDDQALVDAVADNFRTLSQAWAKRHTTTADTA